jgi:hypothetical protein
MNMIIKTKSQIIEDLKQIPINIWISAKQQ